MPNSRSSQSATPGAFTIENLGTPSNCRCKALAAHPGATNFLGFVRAIHFDSSLVNQMSPALSLLDESDLPFGKMRLIALLTLLLPEVSEFASREPIILQRCRHLPWLLGANFHVFLPALLSNMRGKGPRQFFLTPRANKDHSLTCRLHKRFGISHFFDAKAWATHTLSLSFFHDLPEHGLMVNHEVLSNAALDRSIVRTWKLDATNLTSPIPRHWFSTTWFLLHRRLDSFSAGCAANTTKGRACLSAGSSPDLSNTLGRAGVQNFFKNFLLDRCDKDFTTASTRKQISVFLPSGAPHHSIAVKPFIWDNGSPDCPIMTTI